MVRMHKRLPSERFEAQALAEERAARGYAGDLERTHDPELRAHYKTMLMRKREAAAFNRAKAEEFRAKGL